MQIEPISFTHQDLLSNRLRQMNLLFSEYSFANLYLFRDLHRYEVIKIDGEIFIKGFARDRTPFIMLTSLPEQTSFTLLRHFFSLDLILFPIPDEWVNALDKMFFVQSSFKDEDSDYLYSTTKLATYSGRHLDGKRNLVKHFLNHNKIKSENMSKTLISDAQYILDNWQAEHAENTIPTDYVSCYEAIHHFHLLQLHGRIVYVDQKPSGFIIGEWINKDCYAVHFSKASRSIKGLYQYLLQDLAQSIEGTCSWINLEQDLGIPELRYSKLSYHPDLIMKKWRVKI